LPASDNSRPPGPDDKRAPSEAALRDVVRRALERVAARKVAAEPIASEEFVGGICTLLLAGERDTAEAMVRSRIARRQRYAELADGVLAACARTLGARWDADEISFAEVALAMTELHRLHQRVGRRYVPISRRPDVPHAVFATLPRQSHTFGIILAAEGFRQNGWEVDLQLDTLAKRIVERVRRLRPDAVGLTVSRSDPPQPLRLLIGQVTKLPFRVPILLGGNGAQALCESLPPMSSVRVVTDIESALKAAQPGA